jgi:hypothetical protein
MDWCPGQKLREASSRPAASRGFKTLEVAEPDLHGGVNAW